MTNPKTENTQSGLPLEDKNNFQHRKDNISLAENESVSGQRVVNYAQAVKGTPKKQCRNDSLDTNGMVDSTTYATEFGMTDDRYHAALRHCMHDVSLLPSLREITLVDKDAITLLLKGVLMPPQLPKFLWQCLSLHQIEQLTLVLAQQNHEKLFIAVPPNVRLVSTMKFYGILRQISSNTLPTQAVDPLQDRFVDAVTNATYEQQSNVVIFTFRTSLLAKSWAGRVINIRGMPTLLKGYVPSIRDLSTAGLSLRIKEKMNYSITLLKIDPSITFSKLKHFLEEKLMLPVLQMDNAIHPVSKTVDRTSWTILLNCFECPDILFQRTRIDVDGQTIYVKHNRFFHNAPCLICISARHTTSRCPAVTTGKVWSENILSIHDYVFPKVLQSFIPSLKRCSDGHQFVRSLHNFSEGFIRPQTPQSGDSTNVNAEGSCYPAGSDLSEQFALTVAVDKSVEHLATTPDTFFECANPLKEVRLPVEGMTTESSKLSEVGWEKEQPVQHFSSTRDMHSMHQKQKMVLSEAPVSCLPSSKLEEKEDDEDSIPSFDLLAHSVEPAIPTPADDHEEILNPQMEDQCEGKFIGQRNGNNNDVKRNNNLISNDTFASSLKHASKAVLVVHHLVSEEAFEGVVRCINNYLVKDINLLWFKKWFLSQISLSFLQPLQIPSVTETVHEEPEVQYLESRILEQTTAGPSHTVSEQREFYTVIGRREVVISGLGQCLWMALFAASKRSNVFSSPKRAAICSEYKAFKTSMYTRLSLFLPQDVHEVHFPLVDKAIKSHKDPLSVETRMQLIEQYFRDIIQADMDQVLDADYWGSSMGIELAVQIFEAEIFVLEFNSAHGNSLLHHYQPLIVFVRHGLHAQVKYQVVNYADWASFLSNPEVLVLLHSHTGGPHYNVLLPKHFVSESTTFPKVSNQDQTSIGNFFSMTTATLPPENENGGDSLESEQQAQNSVEIDPVGTISSDPLQAQLDALSTPVKEAAIELLDTYISPRTAAKDLEQIAITTATKKQLENHFSIDGITTSSSSTSDAEFCPSQSPVVAFTIREDVNQSLSFEAKMLHSNIVVSLFSDEDSKKRQECVHQVYLQAFSTHQQLLAKKSCHGVPKLPIRKSSLKYYLRWSSTSPGLLMILIKQSEDPLLFMRQLGKVRLLELGEHVYVSKTLEYFSCLTKRAVSSDLRSFLEDWSTTIRKAPTDKVAYVMASTGFRWERIGLFYSSFRKYASDIKVTETLKTALVLQEVIPRLFPILEVNATFDTTLLYYQLKI